MALSTRLNQIRLSRYKSIKDVDLELRDLNVLIGANGAGKSNLISFFYLLNYMMSGNLQGFVTENGFANSLVYKGTRNSPSVTATLHFHSEDTKYLYSFALKSTVEDRLYFAEEEVSCTPLQQTTPHQMLSLGKGHEESRLRNNPNQMIRTMHNIMNRWRVYHFHDTSQEAKIRRVGYLYDAEYLRDNAGNLAAFLHHLMLHDEVHYKKIVSTIQLVAPFFGDFVLQPMGKDQSHIILRWREKGSDLIYGAHQLSDGTLRMIALTTLLQQPKLPYLILLDEPELGLHPYAISILASMIKSASRKTQIIVSTQSVSLLKQFALEDLIVVEREEGQSVFKRLKREDFEEWLEEYEGNLAALWEANVFGGRPSQ
jgi:predicted ATPase